MDKGKRNKIINALITEPTRKKACEAAGISERALYNYMQDSEFTEEYYNVLNGIVVDTTALLKRAAHKAVEHLISVIEDETIDAGTRIKADRVACEMLVKISESGTNLKYGMLDAFMDNFV